MLKVSRGFPYARRSASDRTFWQMRPAKGGIKLKGRELLNFSWALFFFVFLLEACF
ncbi:MAG: hypothetical protein IKR85_03055 [Clostridia bacterium]|nr:hypothetical protein [Clostridia bacterium]